MMNKGDDVYPGPGPLEEGKTLRHASIVLIVLEYKVHDDLPRDRMCLGACAKSSEDYIPSTPWGMAVLAHLLTI